MEEKPMTIRTLTPHSLELDCDVPKCFVVLSAMPGRKKWVDRKLVFAPTGASLQFILTHWPAAIWEGTSKDQLDTFLAIKQQEQTTREEKHEQLHDDKGYEYKTIPYNHQKQGFILGRDRKNFAYLWEQGTGKTKVCLDTFAYQWDQNHVDVLIVIAPNGVHSNWIINEVPIHLPDRIKAQTFTYSTHMSKAQLLALDKFCLEPQKTRPCAIVAFNVDGFTSSRAKELYESLLKHHRCMVVEDESNDIQNPGAMRTQYLIKTSRAALYKRICNGTPITKGAENLYAQFKFLDPLILGYDSFTTFKAQYCWIKALDRSVDGRERGEMIVGYKNIAELANVVDGHSHRVLKKDCLDLPEKVYKKHFFEMTSMQALAYETVRKSALLELQEVFGDEHGRKLALEIALTRLIRLQQIVCGWVPFSKGEAPVQLAGGNPRMSALLTLLAHVDEKAIIWVNAPNSVVDISFIAANLQKEKLGKFVQYHGGIGDDDRNKAIYDFQHDKSIKWFLASKAAYRGLTLTAADQAFYYTNNFDLGVRLQSEDRNHRIGSEIHESITYTDIYTNGIDKKIVNSLRNKKSIADQVTMDPRTLFME